MTHFNSKNYGDVFSEFILDDRLMSLDSGSPNKKFQKKLNNLKIRDTFANHKIVDANMASMCLAGICLLHDYLDKSHKICQSVFTLEGSYWHGILHRREGDYYNSKYWFGQVGKHPVFKPLQQTAVEAASKFEQNEFMQFLSEQKKWNPMAFVDLCAETVMNNSQNEFLCRKIQQYEWSILFDYCYRAAIDQ